MKNPMKIFKITGPEDGFTIIELLVAVALSGIVMTGVYSAYFSQQKTFVAQQSVVDIQQNLRAAMYIIERDFRMAGLDPLQRNTDTSIIFGFKNTAPNMGIADDAILRFTEDLNSDGVINSGETITYQLTGTNITRDAGGGAQIVAENIEVLQFYYLDTAGAVIATPIAAADLPRIQSIQVAILGRGGTQDTEYTNTLTFSIPRGTGTSVIAGYPKNDRFHRKLLTAQIKSRNIGLKNNSMQ
jgi:type IV pilus assembly protein PilW